MDKTVYTHATISGNIFIKINIFVYTIIIQHLSCEYKYLWWKSISLSGVESEPSGWKPDILTTRL